MKEKLRSFVVPETRSFITIYSAVDDPLLSLIFSFKEAFLDGIIFSNLIEADDIVPLRSSREVLGSTLEFILFDARDGFPLDYFLSVANTVEKGGILVLLLDPCFPINIESRRFCGEEISTPYFNQFLLRGLELYSIEQRHNEWIYPVMLPGNGKNKSDLDKEQQAVISDFIHYELGVFTLFAPRGTGKSWIGSQLIEKNPSQYVLTAPNQRAIEVYHKRGVSYHFVAPDALFLSLSSATPDIKTLIIEEAAKMPLSHLERLSQRFKKVLMISSVENYEGTGQGLREKVFELVNITKSYTLTESRRFDSTDVIAQFCSYLQLKNSSANEPLTQQVKKSDRSIKAKPTYHLYADEKLKLFREDNFLLPQFYHLLDKTHYQTNIQDLRRLMDISAQVFVTAKQNYDLIGAIWGIEEGNLSEELSLSVFRGLRRPKGNLGAQTLSAHSYFPEAMQLRSVRISRISVEENYRHQQIARGMIEHLIEYYAHSLDYISVSYGLTQSLLSFWEKCGFTWIHLGSHKDKTTGLHAALMVYPLSDKGKILCRKGALKFAQDAYYWQDAPFIRVETQIILQKYANLGAFDDDDQYVIESYKQYHKPKTSVYGALQREQLKKDSL